LYRPPPPYSPTAIFITEYRLLEPPPRILMRHACVNYAGARCVFGVILSAIALMLDGQPPAAPSADFWRTPLKRCLRPSMVIAQNDTTPIYCGFAGYWRV
jgi:hypothetical protein